MWESFVVSFGFLVSSSFFFFLMRLINQSSLIIFLFHLKLSSQGLVLGDTDHTGCDPIKQFITRVIPLRATGACVHALWFWRALLRTLQD